MLKLAIDNSSTRPEGAAPRGLLVRVQIARKELGLEDDDYRSILERLTGHRSAKDCSARDLEKVIAEFELKGLHGPAIGRRRDLGTNGTIRKAQAVWISLYQLGAIDDRSDAALEAFGKRQLGVERLQWASEREGFRLIEALKAMADRNGWDQRVSSRLTSADRVHVLKDRLVSAQLARLTNAEIAIPSALTKERSEWTGKQLEQAAAQLSAIIRRSCCR